MEVWFGTFNMRPLLGKIQLRLEAASTTQEKDSCADEPKQDAAC